MNPTKQKFKKGDLVVSTWHNLLGTITEIDRSGEFWVYLIEQKSNKTRIWVFETDLRIVNAS